MSLLFHCAMQRMWWEQNSKATQLENISDRWNICQAVFSCEYASGWYMPVARAWHLFYLLSQGFILKGKLLSKASELCRQQSKVSFTIIISFVRLTGKESSFNILKGPFLQIRILQQRNFRAGSLFSSLLYSLLPTRHHFAFFKEADIKYDSVEFKMNNNNYNIKKHVFPRCSDVSIESLRRKRKQGTYKCLSALQLTKPTSWTKTATYPVGVIWSKTFHMYKSKLWGKRTI